MNDPGPADPVVSPADTPEAAIRAALGVIARETSYSHEAVNRYALVSAVSDAAVALDALLAVGERDKAEIERLRGLLRALKWAAESVVRKWRDGKHASDEIADLDRALAAGFGGLAMREFRCVRPEGCPTPFSCDRGDAGSVCIYGVLLEREHPGLPPWGAGLVARALRCAGYLRERDLNGAADLIDQLIAAVCSQERECEQHAADRERDRQQIARLTEALEEIAKGELWTGDVTELAAAVLADEEDAG